MERILVVEDDGAIAAALARFLRSEGFSVQTAEGQAAALAAIEAAEFDLVLLDVGLKDGNGFSVCSAVRQRTDSAVIFLSASGDEYSVVTGLELGADDYIAKPFRPRELVSRIRSVLRRCGKIKDVAVIGLPDQRLGEIAAAIIELKNGVSCTEAEIQDFCRELPRYKRPRRVIFAKVPRNPTGKIEKPVLRQIYCGGRLVEEQTRA